MAKWDVEQFLGKEVSCVYIAGGLGEARRVEDILTEHSLDYAVDIQPYYKPMCTLFSIGAYAGAAFFVFSGQAAFVRTRLIAAGLKAGIQDDEAGERPH